MFSQYVCLLVCIQVEERLVFYETGAAPRKNIDVMRTAMKEEAEQAGSAAPASKKKRKSVDASAMEVEEVCLFRKLCVLKKNEFVYVVLLDHRPLAMLTRLSVSV
jgi:hypothetical protein